MLALFRILVLVLALVLGGAVTSPASADVREFRDRAGDGSDGASSSGPRKWGDVGKVRVDHASNVVRITATATRRGAVADEYRFWIDLRGDSRPDAVAWLTFVTGPDVTLQRTDRFGDLGRKRCQLRRPQYDVAAQSVRIVIPRRCLHPPGSSADFRRLRVGVETAMDYEAADWAPGRRTYGPWVPRAGLLR